MAVYIQSDFDNTMWVRQIIGTSAAYLAPFGGLDSNDGSPGKPVATLSRAAVVSGNTGTIIVAAGTLNESIPANFNGYIIGDAKKPILSGLTLTYLMQVAFNPSFENVVIKDFANIKDVLAPIFGGSFYKCVFVNCTNLGENQPSTGILFFKNNLLIDSFTAGYPDSLMPAAQDIENLTLINSKLVFREQSSIFNCIIDANSAISSQFALAFVYIGNLNVNGLIQGLDYATYILTSPVGVLIGSQDVLSGFSNLAIEDYTLLTTSLLKAYGRYGSYIGALAVSFSRNGETQYNNLSNSEWDTVDAWKATDPTMPAVIESVAQDFGDIYDVNIIDVYGVEDDSTQYVIDEDTNYTSTDIPSGSIVGDAIYLVIGYTSITYETVVYLSGEVFIGVSGGTGANYSTVGSGVVYEVTTVPDQRIISFKTSIFNISDLATKSYSKFIIGSGIIVDDMGVSIGNSSFDPLTSILLGVKAEQHKVTLLPKLEI